MRRFRLRGLALLVGLTASAAPVAQQVLWHAVGEYGVQWLAGYPLIFVGDLDGDGRRGSAPSTWAQPACAST